MSSSLYSQMAETSEMQLAKTVHQFQSEVYIYIFLGVFQHISSDKPRVGINTLRLFNAATAGLGLPTAND